MIVILETPNFDFVVEIFLHYKEKDNSFEGFFINKIYDDEM